MRRGTTAKNSIVHKTVTPLVGDVGDLVDGGGFKSKACKDTPSRRTVPAQGFGKMRAVHFKILRHFRDAGEADQIPAQELSHHSLGVERPHGGVFLRIRSISRAGP